MRATAVAIVFIFFKVSQEIFEQKCAIHSSTMAAVATRTSMAAICVCARLISDYVVCSSLFSFLRLLGRCSAILLFLFALIIECISWRVGIRICVASTDNGVFVLNVHGRERKHICYAIPRIDCEHQREIKKKKKNTSRVVFFARSLVVCLFRLIHSQSTGFPQRQLIMVWACVHTLQIFQFQVLRRVTRALFFPLHLLPLAFTFGKIESLHQADQHQLRTHSVYGEDTHLALSVHILANRNNI